MNPQELRQRSFEMATRIAEMQYQSQVRKVEAQKLQDPTSNVEYPEYPSVADITAMSNTILGYIDPTLVS